jgi:diguanylate cyclase (GGDEF)-like protein/PAS domain S-box-containing protein
MAPYLWNAEKRMLNPKNRSLGNLAFILFLIFFLIFIIFQLYFEDFFYRLFTTVGGFPFSDLLIKGDVLLLLGLLLFVYRNWKWEVARRKSNEDALHSLQKAVETMQIGVTITDQNGKILYSNPAEAEMHGYSVEDLIGKDARIFGPPEIWKPVIQPFFKRFTRETLNVRKDGSTFFVQLMSDVVMDREGNVVAVVTTSEDITERKRNEDTIRRLAFYDSLTGLPNRVLFNDRLTQETAKGRRHEKVLAIMFVDVDRFKNVNDTLGHTIGDLLLRKVAERLNSITREGDTVSRLSGDEFIIMFPDVGSVEHISTIASKIIARLSEGFVINETEVYITTSIGISLFPGDGESADSLIKNADAAMYYAKEQGRNNYQFYSATINANAVRKIMLQGSLRRALKQNEIIFHYQPQIDLRTGRIVGAEALARWQHPEHGLLGPEEFISLAEETGIISSIGEHLLFTACAQNKAWQEAGFQPIRMAINISTYQFVQKNFVAKLKKVLDDVGLDPKYLELEFTESVALENSHLISSSLTELKCLGVQCSIDDFGKGYSALNYLKYLPVEKLKLDRSFVLSLTKDFSDDAIFRAVISMAHDLHLKVAAEGVEHVQQLEFLRLYKCDEVQGFLFSKPVPAVDFVELLDDDMVS